MANVLKTLRSSQSQDPLGLEETVRGLPEAFSLVLGKALGENSKVRLGLYLQMAPGAGSCSVSYQRCFWKEPLPPLPVYPQLLYIRAGAGAGFVQRELNRSIVSASKIKSFGSPGALRAAGPSRYFWENSTFQITHAGVGNPGWGVGGCPLACTAADPNFALEKPF